MCILTKLNNNYRYIIMKKLSLIFSALLIIAFYCLLNFKSISNSNTLPFLEIEKAEFDKYLIEFDKTYSELEYTYRFYVFKYTMAYIRVMNSRNLSWTLGVNKFTDMTHEEISKLYFNDIPRKHMATPKEPLSLSYPPLIDWRAHGAVTPVKNQSPCACGWAFSTTGAVEGAWVIAGNSLVSLSEEQLLDCSDYFGNNGCNGGFVTNSLDYVLQYGLVTEQNYPYTGHPTICNAARINPPAAKIKVYNHVTQDSPEALLTAVASSPISIDVQGDSWINYSGGVLNVPCTSTRYNYSALVVGYYNKGSPPYYIVKTSWGTQYGNAGYLYVAITNGPGSSCIQGQPVKVIA
jgi:C1A family cysteine protease